MLTTINHQHHCELSIHPTAGHGEEEVFGQ